MKFTDQVLKYLSLDFYKESVTDVRVEYSFERKGYRNTAPIDQEGVSPYFNNETRLAVTVDFDPPDKDFYNQGVKQLVRGSLMVEYGLESQLGQVLLHLEKERLQSELNKAPIEELKKLIQAERYLESKELLDKIVEGKV